MKKVVKMQVAKKGAKKTEVIDLTAEDDGLTKKAYESKGSTFVIGGPKKKGLKTGQATISFSLININEFIVKARPNSGTIHQDVNVALQLVHGARFDWDRKCWVIPLTFHDQLLVKLLK